MTITRRKSRQISIGGVKIGGDAPISVQSMCNTDTRDVQKTLGQINELASAGCEIVRLAVLNKDAADAIKDIVTTYTRCEIENRTVIQKPLLNDFVAGTNDNFLTVINNILNQVGISNKDAKKKIAAMSTKFAAKEAFSKALGTGFSNGLMWSEIEVLHHESGKPYLLLSGKALEMAEKMGGKNFLVSLSDDYPWAQAVVIIED